MTGDIIALSSVAVNELLAEAVISQLARAFVEKANLNAMGTRAVAKYNVRCKDGGMRRFIAIYGEGTPPEIYIMTLEEALALPVTGKALREQFTDLAV